MKIAVVSKPETAGCQTLNGIVAHLQRSGCTISYCDPCSGDASAMLNASDAALVFGGDGTILLTVKLLNGGDTPILGVNLGNLGFLATLEGDATGDEVYEALRQTRYISRMLLEVTSLDGSVFALNEAVIKSASSRPVGLNVYVDDNYLDSYFGDGLIISTPVGSTAYSLSAGGPVLSPDVDAVIINPICAHTLHSRPIVLNSSAKISVKVAGTGGAVLSVDGEVFKRLEAGSQFSVIKSDKTANFVAANGNDFYKKLLQKMNSWGVTH